MRQGSIAAAIAVSLSLGAVSARAADDGPVREGLVREGLAAEERLLGMGDEEARDLSYLPFTREIAASVVIETSVDDALEKGGVPAAAFLEAQRALETAIDLEREVKPGDRLYVRYEQGFTAEGVSIDVGRVLWAELTTKRRGTIAIHRFRTRDKTEHFWLANGHAASPPKMRMPLDVVSISSGFGLRPDPFAKPAPLAATGKREPMGGPTRKKPLPPGLSAGGLSGKGHLPQTAPKYGGSFDTGRYGNWQVAPRPARALFMHEGIDLVAPAGTAVYAAADGVVVGAGPNGRYGNWIRIEHEPGLDTVYGHLLAFAPGIEPGEIVARGELIGFVGSTGRSTGAHLHFEVLSDGKPVNPITHPDLKPPPLRGAELERFRKQVAQSVAERTREAKAGQ